MENPAHRLSSRTTPLRRIDWAALGRGFAPHDFLPSVPSALLCWFLTLIFSVSLAALIFHGPLAAALPIGVGMSLCTAVAVALVTSLTSSLPVSIAIPSDRTAPMLAILTGTIAAGFSAHDPRLLPTCIAALLSATALNGIFLWLLGHFRLGLLVRFLPVPVVGGFMAGAGWLLVKGAFTVVSGFDVSLAHLPRLLDHAVDLRCGATLALALLLLFVSRNLRSSLVIPGVILGGGALFYAGSSALHLTPPQLRALGWLPPPFTSSLSWHLFSPGLLDRADWSSIADHPGSFAAIFLISAVSLLMISSWLEVSAHIETDTDRELQSAGLANFASLLAGGLIGFQSLSITSLALRAGPNSRWVGLLTAAATGCTLLFAPSLASYLPIPLLGGLLLFLGLNFLMEWLVDSWARMRRSDYLVMVMIVLVVAWAGYLIGVGLGLIMAVVLFALRYSLIEVVRLEISGALHRSNVDRTAEETTFLQAVRPSLHLLNLQGFIFFGTAHSLLHRVRLRSADSTRQRLRYLILDFRHVTGLDSSALLSLAKLQRLARRDEFLVLCASVEPSLLHILKRDGTIAAGFAFYADVDHAVEWCESHELESHQPKIRNRNIDDIVQGVMPEAAALAPRLIAYFNKYQAAAGETLAAQGDRTRDLFLIESGRVSAILRSQHGEIIRLRTMGPGSVVGEIGLYLGRARTASILAETDSCVWRLSHESLARMEANDPAIAAALHRFLAAMLAQRLSHANELLDISLR